MPFPEHGAQFSLGRMLLVARAKWWAIAILWRKTMRFDDGGAREATLGGRSPEDLCGERLGAAPIDPFVVRRAAGPVALAGLGPGANAERLASTPSQYRPIAGRPPFITAPCCPRHFRTSGMGEPPIGCNVVLCGVRIFRIADGTIVERWRPERSPRSRARSQTCGSRTRRR
jgi:hypothetical protein